MFNRQENPIGEIIVFSNIPDKNKFSDFFNIILIRKFYFLFLWNLKQLFIGGV